MALLIDRDTRYPVNYLKLEIYHQFLGVKLLYKFEYHKFLSSEMNLIKHKNLMIIQNIYELLSAMLFEELFQPPRYDLRGQI